MTDPKTKTPAAPADDGAPSSAREGTASGLVFSQTVRELLARLEGDASLEAASLVRDLYELRELFDSWRTMRPSDDTRLTLIKKLLFIQRRVMDYVTGSPRRSSPP